MATFHIAIDEYFGGDSGFLGFTDMLERNPEKGRLIRGTGGVRKVRHPDPRRGKGSSGGLRILYLYLSGREAIILLDVYDKDEQENLSAQQTKYFRTLSEQIRSQFSRRES